MKDVGGVLFLVLALVGVLCVVVLVIKWIVKRVLGVPPAGSGHSGLAVARSSSRDQALHAPNANAHEDFCKQMRESFIPSVEQMAYDEQKHLKWLRNQWGPEAEGMAIKFERWVAYYERKAKEYHAFVDKLSPLP